MRSSNKPMKQLINIISVASTGIFLALPAVILHQLSVQASHEVNHTDANGTLISKSNGSDDGGRDSGRDGGRDSNGDSDRGDRSNDRSNSRADNNDDGDNGPTGQQGDDNDNGDDNGDNGPTGQQGDNGDEGSDNDSDATSGSVSDSPTDSGANAGEGDAFEGLRHGNDNRITIEEPDDNNDVNDGEVNGF